MVMLRQRKIRPRIVNQPLAVASRHLRHLLANMPDGCFVVGHLEMFDIILERRLGALHAHHRQRSLGQQRPAAVPLKTIQCPLALPATVLIDPVGVELFEAPHLGCAVARQPHTNSTCHSVADFLRLTLAQLVCTHKINLVNKIMRPRLTPRKALELLTGRRRSRTHCRQAFELAWLGRIFMDSSFVVVCHSAASQA